MSPLMLGGESKYLPGPTASLKELLTQLEAELQASDGPFFCGSKLAYADVSVFTNLRETLNFVCFDKEELLRPHPKLAAFLAELEVPGSASKPISGAQ